MLWKNLTALNYVFDLIKFENYLSLLTQGFSLSSCRLRHIRFYSKGKNVQFTENLKKISKAQKIIQFSYHIW